MLIADRYKIDGVAHVGGMAQVLPCNDMVLERRVAIKVMPGDANRRRVLDELNALLKMRSKHVVQIYDVLVLAHEDLAIVQEYVDGLDFFDDATSPTNSIEYLKLLWQIASGLSDIHSVGIIHRDIKPNNMKVDAEGIVKIFDFGLARDEGGNAATVGFVGTKGFAAPELYAHNATFTSMVDTYAFGATALFIGLRGLPHELMVQPPVASKVNPFSALHFQLGGDVLNILNSCIEIDPNNRPSMVNVRDVLAKHLLQDRHKALVVYKGMPSYLSASNRSVVLSLPSMGDVEIFYDSFDFIVRALSGDVFINNRRAVIGGKLPGACVVALGAPEQKSRRRYITFDLSHPEIVL